MSNATVTGVVKDISEVQSFGSNGFRKRTVVLEQENGKYTNVIPVEFANDDCDRVGAMKIGDTVEVKYFLNGRSWQKDAQSEVKYFLSARAADYRVVDSGAVQNQTAKVQDVDIPF